MTSHPAVSLDTTASPLSTQPACDLPKVRIWSQSETHADYSKAMVNAPVAYDLGLTGHCVRIVISDTGLTTVPHPELPRSRVDIIKGHINAGSFYTDQLDSDETRTFSGGAKYSFALASHGTSAAGMIAAASDGIGMHGMAPGAVVTMSTHPGYLDFTASEVSGSSGYVPVTLADLAELG